MMSLVAYDSEISDSEEEQDLTEPKVNQLRDNTINTNLILPQVYGQELFKTLPLPKTTVLKSKYAEDDDEFVKKKETPVEFPKKIILPQKASERKPTKIFLPALSTFEDDKDCAVPVTKFQPSVKGTGLLSLLPQPRAAQVSEQIKNKSRATLIPDAVKKKSLVTNTSKVPPDNKVSQKKLSLIKYESSDESDLEENAAGNSVDFFSLRKSPSRELLSDHLITGNTNCTTEIPDSTFYTPSSTQSNDQDNRAENDHEIPEVSYYNTTATDNVKNSTMDIDDEVLRKLCGSRARHKGENMQIIDINQKEMLPDPKEWLTKALTEDTSKRTSSSKRRGDEPTTQQRRKHQITYLAHQAKANEQELQNQWSNNRLSKKQTQSKYGF